MYDDSVWERVLAAVPTDRVIFGSDFPLNVYPKHGDNPEMERFIAEARTAGASSAVMRDNALKLFRLNR
jgi:predicted TIM-barrel fold metal-dependent hydrolase